MKLKLERLQSGGAADEEILWEAAVNLYTYFLGDFQRSERRLASWERETIESFIDEVSDPLVCVDEARSPVGISLIDIAAPVGTLEVLVVDEMRRRQGFGSAILALTERYCADRRCDSVELMPTIGAQQFYLKHGYHVKPEVIGGIVYEKHLATP